MSDHENTQDHNVKSKLGHIIEEGTEIVAGGAAGAVIVETIKKIFKFATHAAAEEPLKIAAKIAAEKAEKVMRDDRSMVWGDIKLKVGRMNERVNGRNIADVLMDRIHESDHPEHRVWSTIGKMLNYYRSIHDETSGIQLLKQMALTENKAAFDQIINDLHHNPIEQGLAIAKPYLQAGMRKLLWLDSKFRQLVFLVLGNILVNFIGAVIINGLMGWQILGLILLGVVIITLGLGVVRKHPGFFGGLPDIKTVVTSSAIGAGVAVLIVLFAPSVTPMEFVSWTAFAVTGLMLFVILFGKYPLAVVAVRSATQLPYVGLPLRVIFEELGAVIIGIMLFDVFFPFGHLDDHPRLLVFAAIATGLGLWAAFFKNSAVRTLAVLVLMGIFAFGFIAAGDNLKNGQSIWNTIAAKFDSKQTPATTQTTVTKTETVVETTAKPSRKTRKARQKRMEEQQPVATVAAAVVNNDSDGHDYTGQPATAVAVPSAPIATANEVPVLYGEYRGILVRCSNGDMPTYNYGARGANMCVRTQNQIVVVKYNGLDPVYIGGTERNIATLELGDEIKFSVAEGRVKEVFGRN